MATARLTNPEEVEEGMAYVVEADPYDAPPFSGPPHRAWDAFVVAGDEAVFQWRTPAERIVELAKAWVDGKAKLATVRADPAYTAWIPGATATYVDFFSDEIPELARESDTAIEKRVLRDVAQGTIDPTDPEGGFGYYLHDDDRCASDAANALELPEWASVTVRLEGGPGSGFDQSLVVVASGKSLEDLQVWFAEIAKWTPRLPATPRRRRGRARSSRRGRAT